MVGVGRLLVYGRSLLMVCHSYVARCSVRNLLTFATFLALFSYASLCTWHWQMLIPTSIWKPSIIDVRSYNSSLGQNKSIPVSLQKKQNPRYCNVLESMTRGKWVPRPYKQQEMESLKEFIRMSRDQHNLPPTLERPDGRCGDVTFSHLFGKMHNLLWFRALCDPQGPHPCCYHNRCTANVTVQDCRCPDCYDMRQPIHAEFATWVPFDPDCKVKHFHNKTDTCELLRNTTIVMIGDSFMRHVYIALLSLLRGDLPQGPKHWNTTAAQRRVCRDDFIYQQSCSALLDRDTRHCSNTTKLKFLEYIAAHQTVAIREAIGKISGIPNSYVLLGIGIHDDFNFINIAQRLLYPLLSMEIPSGWPEVIWMSTHAPGLLKTPRVPSQSAESILAYNQKVKGLIGKSIKRVPILDFYQLTKDTMSFDGAHYGRGVNEVKAQIFLNYILERQRVKGASGFS